MTAENTGPEPAREVEIRYQHTTCRSIRVNAAQIREIFGLGGTPAPDLIDRLVALLAVRPSLLDSPGVEGIASWELDTAYVLTHVGGMAPGEAAEFLELAEVGTAAPNPGCVRCSRTGPPEDRVYPCACTSPCAFLGCSQVAS